MWASSLQTATVGCVLIVFFTRWVSNPRFWLCRLRLALARVWASSLQTADSSRCVLMTESVCPAIVFVYKLLLWNPRFWLFCRSWRLQGCGHPACRLLIQSGCVLWVFVYKLLWWNPKFWLFCLAGACQGVGIQPADCEYRVCVSW